jgi:hypothetical protein
MGVSWELSVALAILLRQGASNVALMKDLRDDRNRDILMPGTQRLKN